MYICILGYTCIRARNRSEPILRFLEFKVIAAISAIYRHSRQDLKNRTAQNARVKQPDICEVYISRLVPLISVKGT